MLSRLGDHVRHNVVGYIALFFALTGVAYAAVPLKSGDPAGGDLTGTYPNPTIASGKVGTANFSSTIPAARVRDVSAQVATSGTLLLLPFDVEAYDTANLHSTSANTPGLRHRLPASTGSRPMSVGRAIRPGPATFSCG